MTLARKKNCHLGETSDCCDHDHDLVRELCRRFDALCRYDQYIAKAEERNSLKQFWRDLKVQEQQNIQRLKELVVAASTQQLLLTIASTTSGTTYMNRDLLIVEDDLDQLAMLKRWFIRAGYQVTGVRYPRHALGAAALRPFQVAVINYTLPEMNGIELMHQLRRRLGNIPTVILSYDTLAVSDAETAGAFACLGKPCMKSLLEATVKDAFDQSTVEVPMCAEPKVEVTT